MSRTHDVSWAAGFFDGEGWISIQERNHKTYFGHYLRIGINHVAPAPLHEMRRLFGGTVVFSDKVIGNRKPRYRWVTSTQNAAGALAQMLPYMRNKNQVAALALDFQTTIQKSKVPVSQEILETRMRIKREIQRLNSLD